MRHAPNRKTRNNTGFPMRRIWANLEFGATPCFGRPCWGNAGRQNEGNPKRKVYEFGPRAPIWGFGAAIQANGRIGMV